MSEPSTDARTRDEMTRLDDMSADRLRDYLGTVTLPEVPQVFALYEAGDGTDGEPAEVIGWVFTVPGHGPLIVYADDSRYQIRARDLESVAVRWAAVLGGDLTAVTAA